MKQVHVTFQGNPVTLRGTQLSDGDRMPEFMVRDISLNSEKLSQWKGIKVIVSVPSLDTGVCDLEIRKFNEKAASLPNTAIYAVSLDLPFAQARWCGAANVDHVKTFSDYYDHSFAAATGTLIEGIGLLTRAVFLVDENDAVIYSEYVPEVTSHPDYEALYRRLEELAQQ